MLLERDLLVCSQRRAFRSRSRPPADRRLRPSAATHTPHTASHSPSAAMSSSTSSSRPPVVVVGAGLAGCMSALLLAQQFAARGVDQPILLLEHRADFRREDRLDAEGGRMTNAIKRSINLALSHRGITALKAAGLSVTRAHGCEIRIRGSSDPLSSAAPHQVTRQFAMPPVALLL